MVTITQYFEQAELSLAAYSLNLQSGMSGSNQVTAYIDALKLAGMSAQQAADFANNYTVVNQSPDTPSGFSATVFQNNITGQYEFAIRGSTPTLTDWIGTNFGEIGVYGIAITQALDMFNYVLRVTSASGTPIPQFSFDNSTQSIQTTTGYGTGLLQGATFDVSGDSLGGQLALILGRLAPNLVQNIVTTNAPGFDMAGTSKSTEWLFTQLSQALSTFPSLSSIAPDWSNVIADSTNLVVPGDVVHEIGTVPGTQTTIFSTGEYGSVFDAHSIVMETDSLAVYNLFAKLFPPLNTDPNGMQTITNILNAESNIAAKSLEPAITELSKLFGVTNTTFNSNQFDLYKAIDGFNGVILDILEHNAPYVIYPTIQSLVGMDAATLVADAQTDIAYRYALVNLNPFVATGMDYSGFDTNGELDLNTPAAPTGKLTEQYLNDRAAMLQAKITADMSDASIAISGSMEAAWAQQDSAEVVYVDKSTTGTTEIYQGNSYNLDTSAAEAGITLYQTNS